METATEYQMKLVQWDLFCTFTWAFEKVGTAFARRRCLEKYLDNFRRLHTTYETLDDLPYVSRSELGELNYHPHYHVTVAGVNKTRLSLNLIFSCINSWKPGISQVRLFDPSRGGCSYMVKGRFSSEWALGANAYELKKFGSQDVDELYISRGAMKLMAFAKGVHMEEGARFAA